MAKLNRRVGATSNIFQVFIADSSSTTGAGLTGLVFNSSSLVAYYHRDTDTTATAITLVTMTVGTFTSSGFKEIDATNMPGWYQLCPPDAALATGAKSVGIHLKGATNMAPLPLEIDLDAQVDVTHWLGTVVASPATAGIPDVNAKNINNVATTSVTTISANVGTTQPLNFTGTAGSALVKSDTVDIAGAAVSATTAQLGVNVVNWNNTVVATPATAGIPDVNAKNWNNLATVALPLVPTTAGRTLDVSATGEAGLDWANIGAPTTSVALTGTTIASTQKVDIETIKTNPVVNAGTVTFPTTATLASTTNITAGTITTVTTTTTATNLTNAPTAGDFTATMKTSLNAATPASVTGAVGSVTGNVGGNVVGSVGSVVGAVGSVTGNVGGNVVGSVASVTARVTANTDQWNGVAVGSIPPDAIFIRSGTAQAGAASTITLDSGASATNNLYQNETIFIRSGTGAGQSNIIVSYVGATKVATVSVAWATNPDNTSVFTVMSPGPSIASVSGTVSANVTQWLGSAVSAATAGIPDVNTKNINNVAAATPGAAGGVVIAGTNAATSFTSGLTISNASGDALTLTSSGSNGSGVNASGNGTGQGIKATGGATGHGIHALGGASSGSAARFEGQGGNAQGIHAVGFGAGAGIQGSAGATGIGLQIVGGSTSGVGVSVTTTAGDGVSITPTAGSAVVATANGTSKHGIVATGGTAGTSDGIKAVAGTGGVPIRGDITANITGSLSGSVGSVTGNVGGNVTGSVGSVAGAVGSVTGNVGGNVVGSVGSVAADVGITQAGADKVFGASGAAMAELSGVPSGTPSPRNAMMLIFMTLRNKLTTTATSKSIYNDGGSAIASKVLSDNGTTYTEDEMA